MKKSLFFVSLLFFVTTSFAQIKDGKIEVSASGTFGSFSTSTVSNSYSYESEGKTYLSTSIKLGYHLISGFEIEPELYTYIIEKSKPTFVISTNVLYNYSIPDSKIYPFVLLGYGLGNSYPIIVIPNVFIRMSDEFNVGCFNAGVGLKYFINDNVGLRIEYRYQKYSHNDDMQLYNSTQNNQFNVKMHSVLFGFSILL